MLPRLESLMPQSFIRITSRPEGAAPEAIRDKWIGLVLPVQNRAVGPRADVVSHTQVERRDGYVVRWYDAMRILAEKHPDARDWWERSTTLTFEDSCCEVARDFEL
jgi:hypothetical protein